MFRNQYLLTSVPRADPYLDTTPILIGDLSVYGRPPLNLSKSAYGDIEVLLIGEAIDPLRPEASNDQLASSLARECAQLQQFFERLQSLTGRFVFIYRNSKETAIVGDAQHARQIFYSFAKGALSVTSSPMMYFHFFQLEPSISPEVDSFIQGREYRESAHGWLGEGYIDDRLRRLLPNSYLDIVSRRACRKPIFYDNDHTTESQVIETTRVLLQGAYEGILSRYPLVQALTAGLDSRILLAASRKFRKHIEYYVFKPSGMVDHPDIYIPTKLSRDLDLKFRIVEMESVSPDFLSAYCREHLDPRSNLAAQIESYPRWIPPNAINLAGLGGEIVRYRYGYLSPRKNHTISPDMLLVFGDYRPGNELLRQQMEEWLPSAVAYADKYNFSVLELFYWEHHMGIWGARGPAEGDLTIEEFWPMNNATFLLELMRLEPFQRKAPDYHILFGLIESLWPAVLRYPINPKRRTVRGVAKDLLKRRASALYRSKQIAYLFEDAMRLVGLRS